MRKSTKIWLLSSFSLILLGSITFTATACAVNWDFSKFSTVELETNTYTFTESFQNLSIDVNTADLTFLPSDNGESKVVCHEDIKQKHSVTVQNDTLTIQQSDERVWYDHISIIGSGNTEIKVYLPQTQYIALTIETSTGDIKIPENFTFDSVNISGSTCDIEGSMAVTNSLIMKITTGDITLKNVTAGEASLTLSTGDITVKSSTFENALTTKVSTGDTELIDITCKNLTHNAKSGDIDMKNVIIAEKMSITTSTGDVELERCDAGEIHIQTSTGDVQGSLLTTKDFHADSNTGDVKVPSSSEGGKCEITCSTGDIHITVVSD